MLGRTDVMGQTVDDGKARTFPCEGCGADLKFSIGDQRLKCPFCGYEKEIELDPEAKVAEQDYHAMLERVKELHKSEPEQLDEANEVRCGSCGGTVVFTGTLTSTTCPYCGSPIQREKVHSYTKRIPVDGVLPFLIEKKKAKQKLDEWVGSRWFAPNDFLKTGVEGRFNGVYLPYWTFDSLTFNAFSGQRGDNYTVTVGTGKNRRTVTRTRWTSASGTFQRFFDDVLVIASKGLPVKFLQELEPWPLSKCMPFTQQVLAGYLARTYDVPLDDGFEDARERIEAAVEQDVRRRIGGDKQRIHSLTCRCDAITFKHLLLPVWMLAYRYKDKSYRVFVNAGTGEVQGERPYSWVKIVSAVVALTVVTLTLLAFFNR
ncbi:DNA-directed RNA polymerase subunit P [Maioricimonas rarisocia]|uniref:DNA-directed RNA polymerase subunit P n=1 Tax=Maioricimonas rarisocia TaxID=2528026 RepID=A0A517Z7D0_9PLAN|nr:DNA-directed RNA polymerase subunit P [Maioricimonas rarisocia]